MTGTPNLRISLTGFVALLGAASINCGDKGPTAPTGPPAPGSKIVYTAIGASDATGHGASVECTPLVDCPDGTGYVPLVARQLRGQGYTVTLRNLGIPTDVIGPDFQALGLQYNHFIEGNFLNQELPFVWADSTLVTVFAGGNDVNTITAALGGGGGAGNQAGFIDAEVRAFGSDYSALISGIRGRATTARIVALNVPNLAGMPFLLGASLPQRQAAQRASVGMTTTVVNALTAQNVAVIDLMCDPRSYMPSNYSPDGFHPNDSGYAFIAGQIMTAATSSSYPSPQGSCSPMTIVQ